MSVSVTANNIRFITIAGLITLSWVMSSFFAVAQQQGRAALETEADTLAARKDFDGAIALYSKI